MRTTAIAAAGMVFLALPPGARAFPYADGPQLPKDTVVPTPWHMTNVRVDFREIPNDFETFCTTFRIEGETPDDINLYFSPFNGRINRLLYYGGLQTRIDGVRADGRFVRRNRGAIFSRWQERDTAAIMPAGGGLSNSLGNEGDFISVRNDFEWRQGRYRLCLRKSDKVEGDPLPENYDADDIAMSWGRYEHTWVRMEATDLQSGATILVGALAIPGKTLTLRNHNILFAEIYGLPNPFDAARVPGLEIVVENFRVDGEDLPYRRITAHSNPIPGGGTEPKLTRIRYDDSRNALTMSLGRFTGRFGRIPTAVLPSGPAVESVSLVAAGSRRHVAALWDGRAIHQDDLPSAPFNIRALPVDPAGVASVRIRLRGPVSVNRLANEAPYLLSGGPTGLVLPRGDYRVTARPFAERDGQGRQGATLEVEFSITSEPPPTEIGDDKLLAHIEAALGAELTEDNIAGEMEGLESLILPRGGVAGLDGLELARNLRVIDLSGNRIRDLAPLARLDSLRELDLSGNDIADVAPLCDLTGLRSLNLRGNRVSGIVPLAGLGSLESLNLSGNEVTFLDSLAGLASLVRLDIAENAARDFRALSALANLEHLDISGNPAANLNPLAALVRLTELLAVRTGLTDLQPLSGLINLRRLDISGNRVTDLRPLGGLQGLTHLAANRNRLVRLDTLAGLPRLEELELASNWIADLLPLGGLYALSRLNIRHNRIHDFSPLHPLMAEGLRVAGMSEQLRSIMDEPPAARERRYRRDTTLDRGEARGAVQLVGDFDAG